MRGRQSVRFRLAQSRHVTRVPAGGCRPRRPIGCSHLEGVFVSGNKNCYENCMLQKPTSVGKSSFDLGLQVLNR